MSGLRLKGKRALRARPKRGQQLELGLRRRAGKGKRMGRPRSRTGVAHKRRRGFSSMRALQVTVRMAPGIRLRNRKMYPILRRIFCRNCRGRAFRIVHYSVEKDHIHLIVEAANRAEMSRGMRSVNVSIGKRVKAALKKAGREVEHVIADRYHERHLTNPRQARSSLGYVVNNHRHHLADRDLVQPPTYWVDPYSSACFFPYQNSRGSPPAEGDPVAAPKTWMLRTGWTLAGPPIRTDFIPALPKPKN